MSEVGAEPAARRVSPRTRWAIVFGLVAALMGGAWKLQADAAEREVLTAALVAAVQNGDAREVEWLLKRGADANGKVGLESSGNLVSSIRALLRMRSDAERGEPILHEAASRGDERIVGTLLRFGADPNARGWWSITALHRATQSRSEAVANLLLDAGADPDARTVDSTTPLRIAKQEHDSEMIQLLRSRGANE